MKRTRVSLRLRWLIERLGQPIDPIPCLLWPYGKSGKGYGYVKVSGQDERVHRVAWELWHGSIPPKPLVIRHRCNTRLCFNPYHLLLGTVDQNNHDRAMANVTSLRIRSNG